jgi:hypothetical protein
MAAEWICDGCGKRAPGSPSQHGGWHKPHDWFERNYSVTEDGAEADVLFGRNGTFKTILSACSRACIEKVAAKTRSHSVVIPI